MEKIKHSIKNGYLRNVMGKTMKNSILFWLTLGLGLLFFASAQASIPLSIRTTNLDGTDGTAVISFMTVDAVRVTAHYGIGNTGNVRADTLSTGNVHYISLTGLTAGSTYQFVIESNGSFYNNSGSPWTFVMPGNIAKNPTDLAVIPLISVRNLASAIVTPAVVYLTAYSGSATSNTRSFLYVGSGSTFAATDFMNSNGLARFGNFSAGSTTYRYEAMAGFNGVTNNVRTFANSVPVDAINPATVIPSLIGPSVFNRNPAAGSTNVAVNAPVSFSLVDNDYLVSTPSVRVTVNGTLYQPGSPGYAASMSGITLNITINPIVPFTTNQRVTVNVFAQDSTGNIGTNTYTFDTDPGDTTAPILTAVSPLSGATGVPTNNSVTFNIFDAASGVSLNTVRVTVNGVLVVNGGVAVGPYTSTLVTSSSRVTVNVVPTGNWPYSTTITVNVFALDVSGNQVAPLFYVFTTGAAPVPDTTPPTTNAHSPARNATGVSNNTSLQFNVIDTGSGVSQNSIVLTVSGNVVVPNSVTPIVSGYTVAYTLTGFSAGQTVNISINASDISGNAMAVDTYYVVMYSPPPVVPTTNWIAPYPISVPTIFDPGVGQTTTLMWPMTETTEVQMKIYDLNGQSIYQRRFLSGSNGATAGINNTYVWDGRDDLGRLQATGIYYFYIISAQAGQQKVLGRGNIIIRRTR